MKKIMQFFNYLINLIYPNVCGICDKPCKDDLCKKCEINLNNIVKTKIDFYQNKNFQKHFYLFKYEGLIKERLIKFKFQDKIYIYKAFVNFMIKNKKIYHFLKNYDIIIPVPIHYKRKIIRGYNQSALIANEISKRISTIQYTNNVLFKKINNKPQSTKNKQERLNNVIGVYSTKNESKINHKQVLLLDDIYTTGNTVNECARVLKMAGAKKVDVLTIAKD